jgi:hypothetical protein
MQNNSNGVNFGEKDVRHRLAEALARFGYKQVDVSKETGIFLQNSLITEKASITPHYPYGSRAKSEVT